MPLVLAAGVAAVVVAAFYLLMLYANTQFRNGMIHLFSQVPVIGGQLAQGIGDGINAVFQWALGWAKVAVGPVVQLVWVPVRAILAFVGQVVGALENLTTMVAELPGRIAAVVTWATAELSRLISQLAALTARVATVAASIPGIARTIAAQLVAAAVAELESAITAARAAAAALVSAAALAAAQEVGALRAWAVAQLLGVSTTLSAVVATLGHVTGIELPDIRGQLAHLAEGLGLLTAANLIGRLLTLERTVTTTIEECVTPTCQVITPQLGILQALLDLSLLGIVGGLVAEAVTDPVGAARGTAAIVSETVSAAEGLATELSGIRL